jgi:hypothetical protein
MFYKMSLLGLAIVVFAIACNKDKFTSVPQVKIKSITPSIVSRGNIVELKGSFTDEEGDLDSALIIYKWYNGEVVVRKDTIRDYDFNNFTTPLPVNTRSGDFLIRFSYNVQSNNYPFFPTPPSLRDTTASLGLIFVDKQKQRSVYVESEKIRLIRP